MLKMERKCREGEKPVYVFKRFFDEPSGCVTIVDQENAVEIAALLVEDFSEFDTAGFLKHVGENGRVRLWEQLHLGYQEALPEVRRSPAI